MCIMIQYNIYKFELDVEIIIANASAFALAIILFFDIYEIAIIFGFAG